jgi:small subunit ribosomal protein S16
MLTIKLARQGKKGQVSFRLLILEKTKDTKGDYLEDLGFYDPAEKKISLKAERINYWLGKGATTTPSVHNLLISNKIISGKKIKVHKSSNKKQEGAASPAVAPSVATPAEKKE